MPISPSHPSHSLNSNYQTGTSANEIKEPGPPHEALHLVLAYLPLFELLAMEEVSKSLRDSIKNDVLIWLDIVVDRPLNLKFSDEMLIKITSKANGRLRTLALMNCPKITEDGLQRVIEGSPLIDKLYLPSCTGLTPEGVIRAVKTLTNTNHILKSVKINGMHNLKKQDLDLLRSCFLTNSTTKKRPIFYHDHRSFSALLKNGSPVDVEVCPKCNEVRMVFDCPKESCKMNRWVCRGCIFCIQRCEGCGRCLELLEEPSETACADSVCLDCWLQLPKCSLCNKPYCNRHSSQEQSSFSFTDWVCAVCEEDNAELAYDSEAEP